MSGATYTEIKNGTKDFSFSWILKETSERIPSLENFYSENGWDIAFVRVKRMTVDGWKVFWQVGNPLLGGIKEYTRYDTADKRFMELVGRVHIDAICRAEKKSREEKKNRGAE